MLRLRGMLSGPLPAALKLGGWSGCDPTSVLVMFGLLLALLLEEQPVLVLLRAGQIQLSLGYDLLAALLAATATAAAVVAIPHLAVLVTWERKRREYRGAPLFGEGWSPEFRPPQSYGAKRPLDANRMAVAAFLASNSKSGFAPIWGNSFEEHADWQDRHSCPLNPAQLPMWAWPDSPQLQALKLDAFLQKHECGFRDQALAKMVDVILLATGLHLQAFFEAAGVKGYVAECWRSDHLEVVIAFRGFELGASQLLQHFAARQQPVGPGGCPRVRVHGGYARGYASVSARIEEAIDGCVQRYVTERSKGRGGVSAGPARVEIKLVGHSGGGAVATVGAYRLATHLTAKMRSPSSRHSLDPYHYVHEVGFEVYTFGSPRVGNERFARRAYRFLPRPTDPACEPVDIPHWRFENGKDLVVTYPRWDTACLFVALVAGVVAYAVLHSRLSHGALATALHGLARLLHGDAAVGGAAPAATWISQRLQGGWVPLAVPWLTAVGALVYSALVRAMSSAKVGWTVLVLELLDLAVYELDSTAFGALALAVVGAGLAHWPSRTLLLASTPCTLVAIALTCRAHLPVLCAIAAVLVLLTWWGRDRVYHHAGYRIWMPEADYLDQMCHSVLLGSQSSMARPRSARCQQPSSHSCSSRRSSPAASVTDSEPRRRRSSGAAWTDSNSGSAATGGSLAATETGTSASSVRRRGGIDLFCSEDPLGADRFATCTKHWQCRVVAGLDFLTHRDPGAVDLLDVVHSTASHLLPNYVIAIEYYFGRLAEDDPHELVLDRLPCCHDPGTLRRLPAHRPSIVHLMAATKTLHRRHQRWLLDSLCEGEAPPTAPEDAWAGRRLCSPSPAPSRASSTTSEARCLTRALEPKAAWV